ncbi:MAG: carboxypeptidase-like regulatory domain-containing protein [Methanolinea sp.]|nr:carboxypeptidase-like regulatory domain-containing protein [Methanolinea sp.]
MRRSVFFFTGALLAGICLYGLALHAGNPLLYSPLSDAVAKDHANPEAFEQVKGDRTGRLVPFIADIISTPGSLVLNIKTKDFAAAARDLREYGETVKNLDTVVIQLDLTEGELEEFRRAGRQNYLILSELLNGTERWDELKTLEVRFRESGDSGTVTSITYEGESLRRRLQDLYREYVEQDDAIIGTGKKFDLDTSAYRSSISDFREIVNSISRDGKDARDQVSDKSTLPVPEPGIFLRLSPSRVSYMDTIRMDGAILSGAGKTPVDVSIFIDSRKVTTVRASPDDSFSYLYQVERIPRGSHTVFATSDDSRFSDIETFIVEGSPTSLTLDPPTISSGQVLFRGRLSSGQIPVGGAPVTIIAGGRKVATVETAKDGSFSSRARLSPGTYRVSAEFMGEGFPLDYSRSAVFEVTVASAAIPARDGGSWDPFLAGVLVAVLCASGAGAYFYLRRRGRVPRAAAGIPKTMEAADSVPAPVQAGDTAGKTNGEEGTDHTGGLPGEGEAWQLPDLFMRLRRAVSRYVPVRYPQSLTPREVCSLCRNFPAGDVVCRFTRSYERFRYSGEALPGDEEMGLFQSFRAAMHLLGGEDN